jgi:hypothetical protein
MTYDEARHLLGGWIQPDGTLFTNASGYNVIWKGHVVRLNGDFSPELLEAIAVYVRGKQRKG